MARRPASSLGRAPASREPKRRFFIYSEGMNTEPAYFKALERAHNNNTQVECVKVTMFEGVGVPFTVAQRAVEKARELGLATDSHRHPRNSFEQKDQVWAVFDRDDHPNYGQAIEYCTSNRVGVGHSNPCFELWLILHDQPFDRADGRHAVQAHLKRLRPEYDPNRHKTPDCADLVTRVEVAETRAEALLARREAERNRCGPPSTTVGRLTRAIRDAARASAPQVRG